MCFVFFIFTFIQPSATAPTPCELELGVNGSGRYPTTISAQFPIHIGYTVIAPMGAQRNLFCNCETSLWMVCDIIVKPGQEEIVRARLDPENQLAPFFIMENIPNRQHRPLVFSLGISYPNVFAEIRVYSTKLFSENPPPREAAPAEIPSQYTNNAEQTPPNIARVQSEPSQMSESMADPNFDPMQFIQEDPTPLRVPHEESNSRRKRPRDSGGSSAAPVLDDEGIFSYETLISTSMSKRRNYFLMFPCASILFIICILRLPHSYVGKHESQFELLSHV